MNLAIKGHYTRGEEVIKILEMLGGRNVDNLDGNAIYYYYTIMNDKKIIGAAFYLKALDDKFYILSLEEFLEKFPYKVGDKVHNIIHNENQIITDLAWDSKENEVVYQTNNNEYVFVNYLRPYKEETMVEQKKDYGEWCPIDYLEFENNDDTWAGEVEVNLGKDYEIQIRGDKTFIVKKKPQYPKTYKECCKILGYDDRETYSVCHTGADERLFENLYRLKVCRDAYWQIAGKQMGWGNPWEPDSKNKVYYIFYCVSNNTIKRSEGNLYSNVILAFPTKEMRDAFLDNFKDLIEECKELL